VLVCDDDSETSVLFCEVVEGFSRRIFKLSTDLIRVLFIEQLSAVRKHKN
jgi:hypothetical protein